MHASILSCLILSGREVLLTGGIKLNHKIGKFFTLRLTNWYFNFSLFLNINPNFQTYIILKKQQRCSWLPCFNFSLTYFSNESKLTYPRFLSHHSAVYLTLVRLYRQDSEKHRVLSICLVIYFGIRSQSVDRTSLIHYQPTELQFTILKD